MLCAAPGDDRSKQKLTDACRVLGIGNVATLRYHGSPMWPEPRREPQSSLRLADAHVDDIAARIAGHITAFEPDTVITHSTYGDYGHVDHAAVCAATIRAVVQENTQTRRALYCLDWPRRLVRLNLRLMRLAWDETSPVWVRTVSSISRRAVANAPAATESIDVAAFLKTRKAASRFYSDEISLGPPPLKALENAPVLLQRLVLGRVRLAQVYPGTDSRSAQA